MADDEQHIPDEGVVDDRNTIEGQLIGANPTPRLSRHVFNQIKKYLDGLEYPATKEEMYDYAARHGAGQDVLAGISALQSGTYHNAADALREIKTQV
jgi:hypothetical protein